MLRFLVYSLVAVFLISLVRMFIGIILKGFGDLLNPQSASEPGPEPAQQVPAGGELKKDPVCGTYVSEVASIKRTVKGQTVHFCSTDCRDKFQQ